MKRVICEAMIGKEIDIDINFKMWPCCIYQNIFAEFGKTGDPYIDNLPSDWNDVRVHGFVHGVHALIFSQMGKCVQHNCFLSLSVFHQMLFSFYYTVYFLVVS